MYKNLTDEQVIDLRLVANDMQHMLTAAQSMKEAAFLDYVGGKCTKELAATMSQFCSGIEHFHKNAMSELTFFIH